MHLTKKEYNNLILNYKMTMYGNTEAMRQRLHNIYDQQIRMTGALEQNEPRGMGCNDCNAAFKLGSSMIPENYGYGLEDEDIQGVEDGINYLPFVRNPVTGRQIGNPYPGSNLTGYNAYGSSEPFFFRPVNTGGRKRQMKSLKKKIQRIPDRAEPERVADELNTLVNQLVPLGYHIADIFKMFQDGYQKRYGGAAPLLNILQAVGDYQYDY